MAGKEINKGSITWSDHALVTTTLAMNEHPVGRMRQWRLNESLLEDKVTLEEVIGELQYYFQYNSIPETDAGIIWEAHTTRIRGVLIKHDSRIKKNRETQLNKLLTDIQVLETKHKQKPGTTVERELLICVDK